MLDGTADADIEAALPPGACENPPHYLGAKTISRALRRLSINTSWQSKSGADVVVVYPGCNSQKGGLRQPVPSPPQHGRGRPREW